MKSNTIKLKLEKKLVIKKLQDKLKSMQKEHENLVKKFNKEEEAFKKWTQTIRKKLQDWEIVDVSTYDETVRVKFNRNSNEELEFARDTEESDLKRSSEKMEYLQKQIQLLEMCIDETVPMSMVDDIVNYL